MGIMFRRYVIRQWPHGIGKKITDDLPLKVSAIERKIRPGVLILMIDISDSRVQ